MSYKRVFVDANVLIDFFDTDRPLREFSVKAIQKLLENGAELYTSCDLITTVYYILRKKFRKEALVFVEKLAKICSVVPFSNEEVEMAMELMKQDQNFKDLEDTFQYVLAKKMRCDLILSNYLKMDYLIDRYLEYLSHIREPKTVRQKKVLVKPPAKVWFSKSQSPKPCGVLQKFHQKALCFSQGMNGEEVILIDEKRRKEEYFV